MWSFVCGCYLKQTNGPFSLYLFSSFLPLRFIKRNLQVYENQNSRVNIAIISCSLWNSQK